MISNRRHFEIVFPSVPLPVTDVWRALTGFLVKSKALPKKFFLSQITGHPQHMKSESDLSLTPDEILYLIEEKKLDGFAVNTGYSEKSVSYKLAHAKADGSQTNFSCYIGNKASAPADWSTLIEGLLTLWPGIGAWQWDHLYRTWQWAPSERGYEENLGSIPPYKRIIEKSPCPGDPDREFFDISLNPGRPKQLLLNVRFYPTSEMWLGPHFWQFAKCTKEEVLAADFFIEMRDTPHFLYLKSWHHPFTRPDGEQGRVQQKLWQLLFHEECEWPPGSGGISDKPMYGPPALMPSNPEIS
jgi:hypothetical protein